jgi:hypothetical protein
VHDFWVSNFCMHDFFLYYSSVLMCFLLRVLFYSYVFGCLRRATTRGTHLRSSTTLLTKVVKGIISYGSIQANNTYYKKVLGLK